jgi:tellurite resistance protein
MWLNRPEGSFGREARAIANILHAGAKLRIDSQNEVMRKLFDEAMRLSDRFDAQAASNIIWAAATALEDCGECIGKMLVWLKMHPIMHWQELASDDHVIITRVERDECSNASNALWSIATLKVSDDRVITALSQACVDRVREMNAQDASNALWSIATLKVSDDHVITALSQACVDRVREMNAQDASNALWSIATLKVSDDHVITALSQACVDRVREMNAQMHPMHSGR